jgi:NADPH:quinone reductase-like Zn-dependent oxidoreductase
MQAIVQEGYGSPDALRLRDIAIPAIGDDGVLVKVAAASVNAADWHLLGRLPHLIGRILRAPRANVRGIDVAGRVEAVGRTVTRFKPGDEVFGAGTGTFAEYTASTEPRLAPKPRNLSFEQAAALPVAGLTALQGLRDKARLRAGQRVLVYGAGGGVGTLAVQVARALGADVTAVSGTRNLDLLRSIGAGEVIDYTREDFAARGQAWDILFDVGANRSFADCRRALTADGTMVLVGAPKGLWRILSRLIAAQVLSRSRSRRVVSFLARMRHEDLLVLKGFAEAGALSPVIDRRYPLAGVPDAIRHIGTGAARGKVVISIP